MLVDDGVVKSLNKEPNPGEAKVSGAETMLQQLS
jgi:peroxiredoxin